METGQKGRVKGKKKKQDREGDFITPRQKERNNVETEKGNWD